MAARFEEVRKALKLSMRAVGREAMRNEGDYNLAIGRLKEGGSPGAATLAPLVNFFASKGYRREWLQFGVEPKRGEGEAAAPAGNRYPFAPAVVEELIREGAEPERAKAVVFDLLFQEGPHGVSQFAFYRTAKAMLDIAAGRLKDGHDIYSETQEPLVKPKKRN